MEFQEEDSDWTEAKKRLEADLSPSTFQTWIAPLLFERNGSEVILRAPNKTFGNWVKKKFSAQLQTALGSLGLTGWKLEEFTPEQQKRAQARMEEAEKLQKEAARAAARAAAPPDEDVDSLPPDEQFERLYAAYPKQKLRKTAFEKFRELFQAQALPKISVLLNTVRKSKKTDESWHRDNGQYIPYLHNWLSKERWLD